MKLSEYLQNSLVQHQGAANWVITYLYSTHYYAIEYSPTAIEQQVFTCTSDAAFADNPTTWCSIEGFLFQLYGGPIDWKSTKQKTVTTSSTEAEFLALSHAAKESSKCFRISSASRFHNGSSDSRVGIYCLRWFSVGTSPPKVSTTCHHNVVEYHKDWNGPATPDPSQISQRGSLQIHLNLAVPKLKCEIRRFLNCQQRECYFWQVGLVAWVSRGGPTQKSRVFDQAQRCASFTSFPSPRQSISRMQDTFLDKELNREDAAGGHTSSLTYHASRRIVPWTCSVRWTAKRLLNRILQDQLGLELAPKHLEMSLFELSWRKRSYWTHWS